MSQPTTRPTVVFIHGAWHKASCWDATRAELHKLDYPTEAIQLKSSGSAVATHREDTAIIRGALESLILQGKHVVLVMHSYGGKAGANAVSGLGFAARDQSREKGGIIHCVFLAGFLIPKGKSLTDMFPGRPEYIVLDVGSNLMGKFSKDNNTVWLILVGIAARGPKISRGQGPQKDFL